MSREPIDVAVVDCAMGNIHSVTKAIGHINPTLRIRVTARAADIEQARCVILPGDGAFDSCIDEIDKRQLRDAIIDATTTKPFLGICVGMQVLYESSEEGERDGLGILPGRVFRLPATSTERIPHIGWNRLTHHREHPLIEGIRDEMPFYFLHSYAAPIGEYTVGASYHGSAFSSIVVRDHVTAIQFHPEKSRRQGLSLLRNFFRRLPANRV